MLLSPKTVRKVTFFLIIVSVASSLAACSPDPGINPVDEDFSVTDSSGVFVAVSDAPAWGQGEAWALSQEPVLSIGAMEGPEEYILYRSGVPIRLEDGTIAVADGGSQKIRFYDASGRFVRSIGGNGEGPGEFRSVGYIWRLGADSLAVLDFRLFRISTFDLTGNFGRVVNLEGGPEGLVFPSGIFQDGTLLALASSEDTGDYSEVGSFRDRVRHLRYGRDGEFLGDLVTLPGSELVRIVRPDGSGVTTSPRHGLQAWTFTAADTWYSAPSDAYEIQEWSMDGTLLRLMRIRRERRATPSGEVAAQEERLQDLPASQRDFWSSVPTADRLPAYEQVLLDRAGNFWMAEYQLRDEPPLWQVISPEGRWLGSVSMPPGGRVSEIGDDYVLGIWRDEMDVERIRMYALEKPSGR